jgi:hypothetical protein
MGQLRFQIPGDLDPVTVAGLAEGYSAGLPDYMPWPTECRIENGLYTVSKEANESGSIYVPWKFVWGEHPPAWLRGAVRRLVIGTATLGEREEVYHLLTELARGKVNQIRNQAADWQSFGLTLSESLIESLKQASLAFARTVTQPNSTTDADRLGLEAITSALRTGEALIDSYIEQVLATRKAKAGKIPFYFSCGLEKPLGGEEEQAFLGAFNSVRIPFNWREVEPRESSYLWDRYDAMLAWSKQHDLQIEGGPIVDFAPGRCPLWLEKSKGDVQAIANLLLDYLEATLERYRNDIVFWTLTGAAQDPSTFGIDEEELIWLNAQLIGAAKQIHPEGRFSVSLSQPWGEPLARGGQMYSAFVFADALLRSRANLTTLNLEFAVGWSNRGSRLRDFIETSRMLDLYALFGVPITMYLAMPSGHGPEAKADPAYPVTEDGNRWTPELQAAWAVRMLGVTASKPYALSVSWSHWSDAEPHSFAHGGLVDADGKLKPVVKEFQQFREAHLAVP